MREQNGGWVVRRGLELARYLARIVVTLAALCTLTGCERRATSDTAAERPGDYRGVAVAPPASAALAAQPLPADAGGMNRANRADRANRGDAGCVCAPGDPLCTCL
jgi:hypothetical protein